jgi:hypothetical protein
MVHCEPLERFQKQSTKELQYIIPSQAVKEANRNIRLKDITYNPLLHNSLTG